MAVIENDVIKVTVSSSSTRNVIRVSPGVSALSSVSLSLNELNDVDTTGITNGQTIVYENGSFVAGDAGAVKTINDEAPDANGNVEVSINDLTDVKILGTPSEGDALIFSNDFWTTGDAGASVLDDLTDVNVPTPDSGAFLKYNGSQWTAQALSIPSVPATYYHQRYATDAQTFLTGATETVELYYTARADGDGLHESAQSDTPTAGYDIQRKLYYSEKAKADPDTSADWTQFTAIADNTSYNDAKTALLAYLNERTGGTSPISLKITWEEVVQAPSFTGLLNEAYGSGAEAAYSTRRLNGNYSGDCMLIRRDSDGTTQSIGFIGEEIDESAIETFCTGTTCTVQVWRDQSGNGNDATQTTAANQPTIYTGGQLVKEGGRLALDFDGSDDYLKNAGNLTYTSGLSLYMTYNLDANTGTGRIFCDDITGTQGYFILFDSGFTQFNDNDTGFKNFTQATSTGSQVLHSINFNGSTGGYQVAFDGNNTTGTLASWTGPINSTNTANIGIMASGNGAQFGDGKLQEIIAYPSDKSANRTDIEGNISAYFQSAKLLDEQFGEGAEAAYSTRQLRRDQTDCMVIRRASDSTTTTIGFDASGNIDEAAIETFCTGTTCTVVTWKDQSGNGNDATAAAPTNEPTIYTGGAILKNSKQKVTLRFASGDQFTDIVQLNNDPLFTTAIADGFGRRQIVALGDSVAYQYFESEFETSNKARLFFGNGGSYTGDNLRVVGLNGTSLITAYKVSDVSLVLGNGSASSNALGNNYDSTEFLSIAARNVSQIDISEVIAWQSDKLSVRTSIESNIGDYFTQNTPLLDTYSGAAAAYSLRKLNSSYTGAAIEVYAGTNGTADIGFNVFGELDTVALAAHCGSNDGFVSKWYDQSGNSVTVGQTTTTNMPKIYDGTTGVITENGKPAILFDGTNDVIFQNTSLYTAGSQRNSFAVAKLNSTASGFGIFTTDWVPRVAQNMRIDSAGFFSSLMFSPSVTPITTATGSTTLSTNQYLFESEYVNTDLSVYLNGSLDGTTTHAAAKTGACHLSIGTSYNNNFGFFNGTMQEIVCYETSKSDDRSDIASNINTFYSIY